MTYTVPTISCEARPFAGESPGGYGGGITCTCRKFTIEIGNRHPIRRKNGRFVATQIKSMKQCWDVYRLHYQKLLAPETLTCDHCSFQVIVGSDNRYTHSYRDRRCQTANGLPGRTVATVAKKTWVS